MAEAPQPIARLAGAVPAWWQARWLRLALKVAAPLSIAGLFVFWLSVNWTHWGDPLIDFPRSLYAAWRLNQGDVLYRDLIGEYGPMAYLIGAAGFRIFGQGLDTMVWLNIFVTIGVVALLRAIFHALGSRLMGWLAPVVFICLFAFGNYYLITNYNFITPYSSQATCGFAGLLLLIWGLLRHLTSELSRWLVVAGVGLGIAYLNKPDLFFAAGCTLLIYLSAQIIWRARQPDSPGVARWLWRAAGWLACGFMLLWLPVFVFFLSKGGLSYAFYATDHVVFTLTNSRILNNTATSPLMLQFFGFDDPWGNFVEELNAAIFFGAGCLIIAWAARQWTRVRSGGAAWAVLLLIALIPVYAAIWMFPQTEFWLDAGEAFAFPVYLATAVYVVWGWLAAWRNREEFKRILGLAVLGVAASLMLVRMILNVRFEHFGFFMMPLSVCFWIHLIVVEAERPAPRSIRANWLGPAAFMSIIFMGVVQLSRVSFDNYSLMTYEVGSGRDRFYTYPPDVHPNGWLLKTMIEGGKIVAPNAKQLAVFPGGVAVNYHLRIRSPLSYLEVFPIAITYAASKRALDALAADPPELVMLYARDLSENGAYYFGSTKASGRDILLWLRDRYKVVGHAGVSPFSATRHGVDFLVPKSEPTPQKQVIPVQS